MAKRSYGQNCALARTADVIGERWTLLLIRDLLLGPRRYTELARSLRGMGSNLLAERLRELEAAGIVEKHSRGAGQHAYALSAAGRGLEPAVLALVRWGLTHRPAGTDGDFHRHEWDLVALKASFQPALAAGVNLAVQFRRGDFMAWATIRDHEMRVGLGELDAADLGIDGTIEDLFLTAEDPAALLASGAPGDLERFMSAFALPQ